MIRCLYSVTFLLVLAWVSFTALLFENSLYWNQTRYNWPVTARNKEERKKWLTSRQTQNSIQNVQNANASYTVCLLLVRWQGSIRAMGIHIAASQYSEVKLLDWVSYGFQFQTSANSLSRRESSFVILWVTWSVGYNLYSDGMFASGSEQWDTFTINNNFVTISSTVLSVCNRYRNEKKIYNLPTDFIKYFVCF
jgi:hypothetical protein